MDYKELLNGPSKGSRLQIPLPIRKKIKEHQDAFKAFHGRKPPTREEIIIKLAVIALPELEKETNDLVAKTTIR